VPNKFHLKKSEKLFIISKQNTHSYLYKEISKLALINCQQHFAVTQDIRSRQIKINHFNHIYKTGKMTIQFFLMNTKGSFFLSKLLNFMRM
jgi:hypothetical protein